MESMESMESTREVDSLQGTPELQENENFWCVLKSENGDEVRVPERCRTFLFCRAGRAPATAASASYCEVNDPRVSSKHCTIEANSAEVLLKDFSIHGTFVNGRRIEEQHGEKETILHDGDKIALVKSQDKEEFVYRVTLLPQTDLTRESTQLVSPALTSHSDSDPSKRGREPDSEPTNHDKRIKFNSASQVEDSLLEGWDRNRSRPENQENPKRQKTNNQIEFSEDVRDAFETMEPDDKSEGAGGGDNSYSNSCPKLADIARKIRNALRATNEVIRAETGVAAFFGASGVGKSTTINFICGLKIVDQRLSKYETNERFEVCEDDRRLKKRYLKIGHGDSMTKSIDILPARDGIVCCDMPGSSDDKPMDNIVNCVLRTQALQGAVSVRPILVLALRNFSADRFKPSKAMFRYVANCFEDDKIFDMISILITKTAYNDNDTLGYLNAELTELSKLDGLDRRAHTLVRHVRKEVADALKSFEEGCGFAASKVRVVRPLDDRNRVELLQFLQQCPRVDRSKSAFRMHLEEQAAHTIRESVGNEWIKVVSCLEESFEYSHVSKVLLDLDEVTTCVGERNEFDKFKEQVITNNSNACKTIISAANSLINKNVEDVDVHQELDSAIKRFREMQVIVENKRISALLAKDWINFEMVEAESLNALMDYVEEERIKGWDAMDACARKIFLINGVLSCGAAFEKIHDHIERDLRAHSEIARSFDDPVRTADALVELKRACSALTDQRGSIAVASLENAVNLLVEQLTKCLEQCLELSGKIENGIESTTESTKEAKELYILVSKLHRFTRMDTRIDNFLPEEYQASSENGFYKRFCEGLRLDKVMETPPRQTLLQHFILLDCLAKIDDDTLRTNLRTNMNNLYHQISHVASSDYEELEKALETMLPECVTPLSDDPVQCCSDQCRLVHLFNNVLTTASQLLHIDKVYGERICAKKLDSFFGKYIKRLESFKSNIDRSMSSVSQIKWGCVVYVVCMDTSLSSTIKELETKDPAINHNAETIGVLHAACASSITLKAHAERQKIDVALEENQYSFDTAVALTLADECLQKLDWLNFLLPRSSYERSANEISLKYNTFVDTNLKAIRTAGTPIDNMIDLNLMIESYTNLWPAAEILTLTKLPKRVLPQELNNLMDDAEKFLIDLADNQVVSKTRSELLRNINRMIRWKNYERGCHGKGGVGEGLIIAREKLSKQSSDNLKKALHLLSIRKFDDAGKVCEKLIDPNDMREFLDEANSSLQMRRLKKMIKNIGHLQIAELRTVAEDVEEIECLLEPTSKLYHLLDEIVAQDIRDTKQLVDEQLEIHVKRFEHGLQERLQFPSTYSSTESSLRSIVGMKMVCPKYFDDIAISFRNHLTNVQALLDESNDDLTELQQRALRAMDLWADLTRVMSGTPDLWGFFKDEYDSCGKFLSNKMASIFRKLKQKAVEATSSATPDFIAADKMLKTVESILMSLKSMLQVAQSFLDEHDCQSVRKSIAELQQRNFASFKLKLRQSEFDNAVRLLSYFSGVEKEEALDEIHKLLADLRNSLQIGVLTEPSTLSRSVCRMEKLVSALQSAGCEPDAVSELNHTLKEFYEECSTKMSDVLDELQKLSANSIQDSLSPWRIPLANAITMFKYQHQHMDKWKEEILKCVSIFSGKIEAWMNTMLHNIEKDAKDLDFNSLKHVLEKLDENNEILNSMHEVLTAMGSNASTFSLGSLASESWKKFLEILEEKAKKVVQYVLSGIPCRAELSKSLLTLKQGFKGFQAGAKSDKYQAPLINAVTEISHILSEKVRTAIAVLEEKDDGWSAELNTILFTLKQAQSAFQDTGISELQTAVEDAMKKVRKPIEENIDRLADGIALDKTATAVADRLLDIRGEAGDIDLLLNYTRDAIRKSLVKVQDAHKSESSFMTKVGEQLQFSHNPLGKIVISENSVFQRIQNILYNEMMKSKATLNIDDIVKIVLDLNQASMQKKDVDNLKALYHSYKSKYDAIIRISIKNFTQGNYENRRKIIIDGLRKQVKEGSNVNMVELVANVCALYSFCKSAEHYSNDGDDNCIIAPHEIQIISIFRLLGIDFGKSGLFDKLLKGMTCSGSSNSSSNQAKNHFMQIPTGEGKSLVLGIVACVFALQGFHVDCVCYSRYLSERDLNDFKDVFDALKSVTKKLGLVRYLTFQDLCESHITGIREAVESVIEGKEVSASDDPTKLTRVLLIDEVDVFFTKRFYGNKHNPGILLQSPEISALIRHVWKCRRNWKDENAENIFSTTEYQNAVTKYKCIEPILRRSALSMIKNVQDLNNAKFQWVVQGGKIGYLEAGDFIPATKKRHQNRTVFAYLFEAEQGRCLESTLEENLGIDINCGEFSYAALPNRFYSSMFGVTGTLQTLSTNEKAVLHTEYNVTRETLLPSAYGQPQLDFNFRDCNHVVVAPSVAEWHVRIHAEIKSATSVGRAVLVCFKNDSALRDYDAARPWPDVRYLTAELDDSDLGLINGVVANATIAGRVTLLTRKFGRGLDFKASREVVDKGGVLVIQTFFSSSASEEVQIKGRTARQGDKGAYRLILCKDHLLQKFGLEYVDGTSNEDLLVQLLAVRDSKINAKAEARQKLKEEADKADKKSWQFRNMLYDGSKSQDEKLQVLVSRNSGCCTGALTFVLLLDVSGSMNPHWTTLRQAYDAFITALRSSGHGEDIRITVIVFDDSATTIIYDVELSAIQSLQQHMPGGRGTCFETAFAMCHQQICSLIRTVPDRQFITIFMTDGEGGDPLIQVRSMLTDVGKSIVGYTCIAFGSGANSGTGARVLRKIEKTFHDANVRANTITPHNARELVDAFATAAHDVALYMK